MKAKSIKGNTPEEIKSALAESMKDGFKPNLAFIFLSSNVDIKQITNIFSSKEIAVFGSTTVAGFIDEEFEDGSSGILLLNLNPSFFRIYYEQTPENSAKDIAKQLAKCGLESFPNPAYIITTSGMNIEVELLIKSLEDTIGSDVFISGGRAGNNFNDDNTFVFTNSHFSSEAVIALIIDQDKLQISGLTSHGWKPLGNEHIITKSDGRTVYTIDNQPALDVFTRFLGVDLNEDIKKEMEYNVDQLGPIQIVKESGNSVIRDVSFFNKKDYSVIFQSNMPEGTKFRFSLPPDFDIIEVLPEECRKLKKEKNIKADAVIMFSCSGRKLALGPLIEQEIEKVKQVWESPMAGFFCLGEIGRSEGGSNDFHNYTSSLVIIKKQ